MLYIEKKLRTKINYPCRYSNRHPLTLLLRHPLTGLDPLLLCGYKSNPRALAWRVGPAGAKATRNNTLARAGARLIILAIDPGNEKSGYVCFDSLEYRPLSFGKLDNAKLLACIQPMAMGAHALAIEYPQPRGQPMYTQLVDTIFWIGRFVERAGKPWTPIDRKDVKMTLCGSPRAKDSNIRAALISRFSQSNVIPEPRAKLTRCPEALKGFAGDMWSALAVAITYLEVVQSDYLS